jgi:hypothetical protein
LTIVHTEATNPEARIAEDTRLAIELLVDFSLGVLTRSIRRIEAFWRLTCVDGRVDGGGLANVWNWLVVEEIGSRGVCRIGHGPRVVIAPVIAASMAA